jgi:dTDP-4-dehydrorhamnose reductase
MKFEPMKPAPPVTRSLTDRHYVRVTELVIGASGLVGSALMRALGDSAIGTFRTRPLPGLVALDASDRHATAGLLKRTGCRVVFFLAADPNVDWCETHPSDAYLANVVPALQTLECARESGVGFVFFSSDYVFDGRDGPYDESARTAPLSVYGRHKLEVEEHVLAAKGTVVRTTTVYGLEEPPGKNFVLRAIARLKAKESLIVPADQISTPTFSDELARGAIAVASRPGLWHVAGRDVMSRDRFAVMVAEAFQLDASLIRVVPTAQLGQPARRPLRSGLLTEKIRRERKIEFISTGDALLSLGTALRAESAYAHLRL